MLSEKFRQLSEERDSMKKKELFVALMNEIHANKEYEMLKEMLNVANDGKTECMLRKTLVPETLQKEGFSFGIPTCMGLEVSW